MNTWVQQGLYWVAVLWLFTFGLQLFGWNISFWWVLEQLWKAWF
jgi:hypothetical protein